MNIKLLWVVVVMFRPKKRRRGVSLLTVVSIVLLEC